MSRDMVLASGRILEHVPTGREQAIARRLKPRLDGAVPSWCLDHCHIKGRGRQAAERQIQAGWSFIDIKSAYPSIYLPRLWTQVRRFAGRRLEADVRRLFETVEVAGNYGVPEGTACSHALFNLYLASVDRRWVGRAVRYADNWACAEAHRLRKELADIGLDTRPQTTFTRHHEPGPQKGRPLEQE